MQYWIILLFYVVVNLSIPEGNEYLWQSKGEVSTNVKKRKEH